MTDPNALLRVENLHRHFDVSPSTLERLLQRKPRATLKDRNSLDCTAVVPRHRFVGACR